jgi:hypothetical protein
MPVSFVNAAPTAWHHVIGTLQMMLTWPCASAPVGAKPAASASVAAIHPILAPMSPPPVVTPVAAQRGSA